MHSYVQFPDGRIEPRHDAGIKERRDGGYFDSVTTKLKFPSNSFLERWRHKEAVL